VISVCIPIYNFNVTNLVQFLHNQADNTQMDVEILLIDDCSEEHFRIVNRELMQLSRVIYQELDANIGRSKIRNLLARKSQYQTLLFLDCDVMITDELFLQNYVRYINRDENVICGGHFYQVEFPPINQLLHWNFGTNREVKGAQLRNMRPYQSFMTSNFTITKSLFTRISFNENLTNYGHEDTLFGLELQKQSVKVFHINNAVLHTGLETNDRFLQKTRESLTNLLKIIPIIEKEKLPKTKIRVLKSFLIFRKTGLHLLISLLFFIGKPIIELNLTSISPSMILLDMYKLGYICQKSITGVKEKA
jgi:GT2 family glycosyltransferase